MQAGQNDLAEEYLALDNRTKAQLIELAGRLLPERERLSRAWLGIFEQAAEGAARTRSGQIDVITNRLLSLFFEYAPAGDFDGFYRSVVALEIEFPAEELPHGLLMLALHQFEQAALPFLGNAYPQQQELHAALVALDRLCDNAIVLIASSYFETSLAELRALQQVTDTALSTLDVQRLMDSLAQSMVEAARADCGAIALRDEVSGELGSFTGASRSACRPVRDLMRDAPDIVAKLMGGAEATQVVDDTAVRDDCDADRVAPVRIFLSLKLGDRPIGVICVGRHSPTPFDSRTIRLLQLLVERAAAAIDHAELYRRTARLLRQTEALQRVTASITSKTALAQVLDVVIDGVVEIFGATRVAICVWDRQTGEIRCPAARGLSTSIIDDMRERYRPQLEELLQKDYFYSPNSARDERLDEARRAIEEEGIAAMLVVPFGRGETRGAIAICHDEVRNYGPDELNLARAFADQAGVALTNATLYREIRERAAELDRLNSELQILDRMKADFLAMISHELRTPLTAILGYTDLLLRGVRGELTERQGSDLKTIRANGNRLLTLINDLIDFSSIEAGRTSLASRTLRIDQVIPRATRSFGPLAEARSIALRTEMPADLPTVVGDAAAVEKIVAQLLSNALKFSSQGGLVVLRAVARTLLFREQLASGRLATMGEQDAASKWVVITISDTGIGIPREEMPRIWDYFYQVDSSSARRFGGTGLGLAIAKRLVELQGGVIWAESEGEAGKGSSFSFALRAVAE